MSIKNKLNEIESHIKTLESNELSFDDQIKLFKSTKKKIEILTTELESKTAEIKALELQ